MSGDEQTFLMTELARLKKEGRNEVIRERKRQLSTSLRSSTVSGQGELITPRH